MGMFDSLYDKTGQEWQTKAFDCQLVEYEIGDTIPADCATTYQVEILGMKGSEFRDSFATVRDGVLASVGDRRDAALPLLNYSGKVTTPKAPGLSA